MAFAIPLDEEPSVAVDESQQPQSSDQELMGIPYNPYEPEPTPPPPPALTDAERTQAIKRSKLQLQSATDEVERLKPDLTKLLAATGMNVLEGAVGSTKQAVGNLARTYTEIVTPEKPHPPGSFKSFLQLAISGMAPGTQLQTTAHNIIQATGAPSPFTQLHDYSKGLAERGTNQLQEAQYETERLGGGQSTQLAGQSGAMFGQSIPVLAAAPLGLPGLAVAGGLQAYGNTINDFQEKLMARDPNLTEQQAYDKAIFPAAIVGATTALITHGFGGVEGLIDKVVKQGLTKEGVAVALKETAKAAAMEFPEEYLQQVAQGVTEKAFVDPDKKFGDILDDAALAGLGGVGLGLVTGGAIHGIGHAASALTLGARRRGVRADIERALRILQQTEQRYGTENQNGAPSGLPPIGGQPAVTGTEGQTQGGVALRRGQGGEGQAAQVTPPPLVLTPPPVPTTDVSAAAVNRTKPPPPPEPKVAVFSEYAGDNRIPLFKIPGVRPGTFREVTGVTARQLGYAVPGVIPTHAEWVASQIGTESHAPPVTQRIPIKIRKADGTIVEGEFNGYYDMRDVNGQTPASIGRLVEGKMSHGLLNAGETIIGKVPTFEEW